MTKDKKTYTCYFWAEENYCKFTEDECDYLHRHTGRIQPKPKFMKRFRVPIKEPTEKEPTNDNLISLLDDSPVSC